MSSFSPFFMALSRVAVPPALQSPIAAPFARIIPTTRPDDVYYLAEAAAAATATMVGGTKLLAALTWQTFSSPLLPSTRRRRRRNSRAHFLLHWETLQATCLGAGRTHGQAPLLRSFVRLLVWQRCRPLPMPDPQSAGRHAADHQRAKEDGFIRPGNPHGPRPAPQKICQPLRRLPPSLPPSCPRPSRRPRHMLDWTADTPLIITAPWLPPSTPLHSTTLLHPTRSFFAR